MATEKYSVFSIMTVIHYLS